MILQGKINSKSGRYNLILKKIKKFSFLVTIPLFLLLVVSCTHNSYVKKDSSFTPEGWKSIVVLPFTGSRGFTYLAAEAFTFHIKAKEHFEIIPPVIAYASINRLGIQSQDNVISFEHAKKIAEQLDAQVLIMGNIETIQKATSFDAIATVKLIDVKSGRTVAESHRPSNLKIKNSEEQCVIISVGNASIDINEFLVDAAGKNIIKKRYETGR